MKKGLDIEQEKPQGNLGPEQCPDEIQECSCNDAGTCEACIYLDEWAAENMDDVQVREPSPPPRPLKRANADFQRRDYIPSEGRSSPYQRNQFSEPRRTWSAPKPTYKSDRPWRRRPSPNGEDYEPRSPSPVRKKSYGTTERYGSTKGDSDQRWKRYERQ